ncbi:MAG: hypothetical protein LBE91_04955 [Tannerella sp.]|jgi:hypothetical protein|nr:hypothetical protein [Tannerella sp.]
MKSQQSKKTETKISFQTVGKYLRELSVVVIGVIITFAISFWVYNKNNEKDLKLYLNALKLELEDNIKIIDAETEYLENCERYSRYLLSHDKKSLNADSIQKMWKKFDVLNIKDVIVQTSAFDMFKLSGTMRLVDDKELLQSVWKAYSNLELLKIHLDNYYQLKMDEAKKERQMGLEGKPVVIPLYNFFITYTNDIKPSNGCIMLSKALKETVARLDKKL